MIFTPLLVGYMFYNFLINNNRTKSFIVLFLIIFSTFITIFSLYPSPINMRPNDQVTIKEVMSMNWLINKKNPELETMTIITPINRFTDLIFGCNFREERKDLRKGIAFPDHFGNHKDNVLPINIDRYAVITEYDIKAYTEVWTYINRFDKEDFIKFDFFSNVYKIYENGEVRNYLVHKTD